MIAILEKEPFHVKGVRLVSESDTEKLMLERIMKEGGGPAALSRNHDGSVELVIIPSSTGG